MSSTIQDTIGPCEPQVLEMQYQHRGQYFTTIQAVPVGHRDRWEWQFYTKLVEAPHEKNQENM